MTDDSDGEAAAGALVGLSASAAAPSAKPVAAGVVECGEAERPQKPLKMGVEYSRSSHTYPRVHSAIGGPPLSSVVRPVQCARRGVAPLP